MAFSVDILSSLALRMATYRMRLTLTSCISTIKTKYISLLDCDEANGRKKQFDLDQVSEAADGLQPFVL